MLKIVAIILSIAMGACFPGTGNLSQTESSSASSETVQAASNSQKAVTVSDASETTDAQTESDADTFGVQSDTEEILTEDPEDIECPDGWDEEDPGWYRAYLQKFGSKLTGNDSSKIVTANASGTSYASTMSITSSTTWDKYNSSSTLRFYHDSRNTSNRTIIPVIDISKWDGHVNFKKVKKDGVKGVIIRCAYRTGAHGDLYEDPLFEENIKKAKAAGLKVGVYVFSQAINKAEAREEAAYGYKLVKSTGVTLDLPFAMDIEYVGSSGRLKEANLSKKDQTSIARSFCKKAKSYDLTPMIYASTTWLAGKMYASHLANEGYQIWMARYSNKAYNSSSSYYQESVQYWQCSSVAAVNGISTAVDLNYWYAPTSNNTTVGKVSGFKISSTKSSSIKVSWKKKSNVSGYQIRLYKGLNKGVSDSVRVSSSKTSYTFKDLNIGEEYYFRIRAYKNYNGERVYGSLSSYISAATASQANNVVTTANVHMRKYGGSKYTSLGVVKSGTMLVCSAYVYDRAGTKWYKVTKGSKTGYISSKYAKYYVSPVSGFKGQANTDGSVTLTWTKNSSADSYVIYRKSGTASSKKIATVSKDLNTYTDKTVQKGTTYRYYIKSARSINGKIHHSLKAGVTITTL